MNFDFVISIVDCRWLFNRLVLEDLENMHFNVCVIGRYIIAYINFLTSRGIHLHLDNVGCKLLLSVDV